MEPLTPEAVAAAAREIRRRLGGARVQGIYQPLPGAVVLELYRPGRRERLVIDTDPRRLGVGIFAEPGPPNPPQPPPFCMLLRKHLEGARLAEASAVPGDRVLALTFIRPTRPQEEGQETAAPGSGPRPRLPPAGGLARLVAELTGRSANLLLEVDGALAGWLRPPPDSRGLRPQEPYRPPPAPPGAGPTPVGPPGEGPAEDGRDEPPPEGAPETLEASAEAHVAGPSVLERFGARWTRQVEAHGLEAARSALLRRLRTAESRLARRLEHRQAELLAGQRAEQWRRAGELLLIYAGQIPPGARRVVLPPPDSREPGEAGLDIELAPNLSPVQNAQIYFRRYRKARRTAAVQEQAVRRTQEALAFVRLNVVLAREAGSLEDLARIQEDLEAAPDEVQQALPAGQAQGGTSRGRAERPAPRRTGQPAPHLEGIGRLVSSDGFEILVGRSARANDRLTLHVAAPDDLWLHARGLPGAHVVVRCGRRDPPERTVIEAAALAARLCAAGPSGSPVDVDVTRRRHVRKPPGTPPGLVVYDHEQTLRVSPSAGSLPQPQAPL